MPELTDYFGGDRAFTFGHFTLSFPLFIGDCPEDVRQVLTEGMQRYVDHETISQVGNIVNQWSFIIRGIQHFSEATDDPWYALIVRRHVGWLLSRNFFGWGEMPAGYFAENGPDATYVGITLHNLGVVYEQTRDAELKEALRRNIDLFNHTVAPEPDGSWQCATSFCTRTPGGWSTPQWGAGMLMLADDFAEAAPQRARAGEVYVPPVDAATLRHAEHALGQRLAYLDRRAFRDANIGEPTLLGASTVGFLAWRHYAEAPLAGQLPVVTSPSFTRAFGEEFMCVRRPGYYSFLYAGKPMADWLKQQRVSDPHRQYPRNAGGLCLFWSPGFGSSLVAKNWSAYAAQTILAERGETADWEDYWSVHSEFDVENASATVTSNLLNQPVQILRQAKFLDSAVRMDVTLTIQGPPNATGLWECFPYPLDKPQPLRVRLLNSRGEDTPDDTASAICFDAGGADCHLIVFSQPRRVRLGVEASVDHYQASHRNGYVLAEVPGALSAGQARVSWLMLAAPSNEAPRAIRSALDILNHVNTR
jgi:hypothetical protein